MAQEGDRQRASTHHVTHYLAAGILHIHLRRTDHPSLCYSRPSSRPTSSPWLSHAAPSGGRSCSSRRWRSRRARGSNSSGRRCVAACSRLQHARAASQVVARYDFSRRSAATSPHRRGSHGRVLPLHLCTGAWPCRQSAHAVRQARRLGCPTRGACLLALENGERA